MYSFSSKAEILWFQIGFFNNDQSRAERAVGSEIMRSYLPFILPLPSNGKVEFKWRETEDDRLVERVSDKRGRRDKENKRHRGTAAVPSSSDRKCCVMCTHPL